MLSDKLRLIIIYDERFAIILHLIFHIQLPGRQVLIGILKFQFVLHPVFDICIHNAQAVFPGSILQSHIFYFIQIEKLIAYTGNGLPLCRIRFALKVLAASPKHEQHNPVYPFCFQFFLTIDFNTASLTFTG